MTRALMLADLRRSGIKQSHTKKLGLRVLTRAQTKKLTGRYEVMAYQIPYYDAQGKETDYWRVRYLEEIRGQFGAHLEKPRRYSQPDGTIPHLYFCPLVDWTKLCENTDEPLVITEGEKKATAGCVRGLPTLGLGGVWAWKSKRHNLDMIPDFRAVRWKERKVYLVFDNDLHQNPLVVGALNALARKLLEYGARPALVYLPKGPGKIGLDDYLLKRTAKQFAGLRQETFEESRQFWELNEKLAIIQNKGAVYDFDNAILYGSSAQLVGVAYADRTYEVPRANGEGFVTKNAVAEWLKWPHRASYKSLTYAPGENGTVRGCVNTWSGWGTEPRKGTVRPFLNLLDFVFGNDRSFQAWFLQWLAYPLQHPGEKMFSSVLLFSPWQGVGKSFIGYIMGDIYGDNFIAISQEELHGNFNDWAARKQFILGEEITGTDRRRDADRLKNILTRESVYVNAKYQTEYSLPDCANFMFTSNHPDAFFVDAADRRVAIHEIPGKPKKDDFYTEVDKWRKGDGAGALFQYLLELDTSDFNPKRPAPATASKTDMIDLSRSDLDMLAHELREEPKSLLQMSGHVPDRDLFTTQELATFIDPDGRRGTTLIAISKALTRAGFRKQKVMTEHGSKKLWPVKNTETWMRRGTRLWAEHYDRHTKMRKF